MHQPVPAIFLSLAPPSALMISMLVTSAVPKGHKIMLGMCSRRVNRSEQGKGRWIPATGAGHRPPSKRNHRGLPEREPLCFVKGGEASGEKHCGTSTKWPTVPPWAAIQGCSALPGEPGLCGALQTTPIPLASCPQMCQRLPHSESRSSLLFEVLNHNRSLHLSFFRQRLESHPRRRGTLAQLFDYVELWVLGKEHGCLSWERSIITGREFSCNQNQIPWVKGKLVQKNEKINAKWPKPKFWANILVFFFFFLI